jgi:hypothetical protein
MSEQGKGIYLMGGSALVGAAIDAGLVDEQRLIVARYATLFNARDWDGLRAMLADDVRLDVVSRGQRSGGVEQYFTAYAKAATWHVVPGWLEGREILAAYLREEDVRPHHVVLVTGDGGRVEHIRDYMYVEYLLAEARFSDTRSVKECDTTRFAIRARLSGGSSQRSFAVGPSHPRSRGDADAPGSGEDCGVALCGASDPPA